MKSFLTTNVSRGLSALAEVLVHIYILLHMIFVANALICYQCCVPIFVVTVGTLVTMTGHISFHFHLFKTIKGQMATDMLIVKQNMMRLIATMNKTYITPLTQQESSIEIYFT